MSTVKAIKIIERWRSAVGARSVWHTHWDDLARVFLPRRLGFATSYEAGEQRTDDIYDGTPMQASRGLANAISGLMRPEGEQWVFVRAGDDEADGDAEAQDWLAESEIILAEEFDNPRTRFRQATGEADLDLVTFGTAPVFVGLNKNRTNLHFNSVHLKDAAVLWDEDGEPIGVFRRRSMSYRQLMGKYGEENLSPHAKEKIASANGGQSLDEKVEILHAITLREEGRPGALFASGLPWGGFHIEVAQKHVIFEDGYHEFPFAIARWDTSSGENYGRSPGMIALPDANTAQAMGETILVAGQRAADPSLMAPDDGSFNEINSFPGGLSYYDVETAQAVGGNPFFPLDTGANIPITREMQIDNRDQIFRAFFRNILNLPVAGPTMTATEVMERKEEFIREIGPVFGRLESDYTAPMVEIAFANLLRLGAFPPIPESLAGGNVRFEYESPVKRIREQVQASAAGLWAQEMYALSQFDPRAADVVNVVEYGKFAHQALNLPKAIVNDDKTIQQQSENRMAQQQQAAEFEALQQAADVGKTAAGAAAEAGLLGDDQEARL
jgi:hypothetical protein